MSFEKKPTTLYRVRCDKCGQPAGREWWWEQQDAVDAAEGEYFQIRGDEALCEECQEVSE